jgi:hypothetical protein
LEQAGIAWSYKQSGVIGRVLFAGEWGTRLFVDAACLDEAREIVAKVRT